MMVYLTVNIDKSSVLPKVGIMTHHPVPGMSYEASTEPDMETVRLGMEVANQVLGFAEGLRREP
jgi:hypothetical protein